MFSIQYAVWLHRASVQVGFKQSRRWFYQGLSRCDCGNAQGRVPACSGVFRHMYVVVCIYQVSMLPEQAENGLRGGTTSVRTGASFSRFTIEDGQQRGCTATGLISSHHVTITRPDPLPNTSSKLNR
jgi:hypothetical protein